MQRIEFSAPQQWRKRLLAHSRAAVRARQDALRVGGWISELNGRQRPRVGSKPCLVCSFYSTSPLGEQDLAIARKLPVFRWKHAVAGRYIHRACTNVTRLQSVQTATCREVARVSAARATEERTRVSGIQLRVHPPSTLRSSSCLLAKEMDSPQLLP